MEIRVLKYFLAIARESSITRAANSLHLTQPTLTRQIQELEKELGHKLFVRGKYKVTLTNEGIMLKKRAEEILDFYRNYTGGCLWTACCGDPDPGAGFSGGPDPFYSCGSYRPVEDTEIQRIQGAYPAASGKTDKSDGFDHRTDAAAGP